MQSTVRRKSGPPVSMKPDKVQTQAQGGILGLLGKDPELPICKASKDNSICTTSPLPMTIFVCQRATRDAPSGTGRYLLRFGLLRFELFTGADLKTLPDMEGRESWYFSGLMRPQGGRRMGLERLSQRQGRH